MTAPVLLVHPGPHGVAVFGRDLAEALTDLGADPRVIDPAEISSLTPGTPVHAQITDRLWGTSPEDATEHVLALAARHPLTVTLHDVPQASDGERNRPRRRAFYAAVARAARAIAVNSEHERALLDEEGVWSGPVAVVPLPVTAHTLSTRPRLDDAVGVLGYFYPGKGHDEALAATVAAGLSRLRVLGRASDGHADELDAFVRRARDLGVTTEVTGWLDDAEMAVQARTVAVPVIAHRHVSASGSLASWIGWGRRPVAVRNRYVDEMSALRPGTLRSVEPEALPGAIREAVDDPSSTWHGVDPIPFDRAEAARAYLRWWGEVLS